MGDVRARPAQPVQRIGKGGDGRGLGAVEGRALKHQQAAPGNRGIRQIGRGLVGHQREDLGAILDAAGDGAGHVELAAKRHDPFFRHRAGRRLEPHKPVPRRRHPDRAARIRSDRRRRQPKRDRDRRPRRAAPRRKVRVQRIGRGRGHRVQAQARKGQFRQMRLAQTDRAAPRQTRQHDGILARHAPLQQARAGLGHGAAAVDIVLPADRHAVQQAVAALLLGAVMGGDGLGPGAGGGQPGIDARAIGMVLCGGQIGLGLVDGVQEARHDGAPLLHCRGPKPIHVQKSTAMPFFS